MREPKDGVLFARFGGALMPIGCARGGRWVSPPTCLPNVVRPVRLYPPFETDATVPVGAPANVYFVMSNTTEPGLQLLDASGSKPSLEEPALGFATLLTAEPVRTTESVREWMASLAVGSACQRCVPRFGSAPLLPSRPASQREESAASAKVAASFRAGSVRVPQSVHVKVITVRRQGAPFELTDAEATLQPFVGDQWTKELDLPHRLHYLFDASTSRLLPLTQSFDFGLQEAGEVLAAVDLDADGTDELVLRMDYSEGFWIKLARWDADHLAVVGEFGYGS